MSCVTAHTVGPVFRFSGAMVTGTVSGLIGTFGSLSNAVIGGAGAPHDDTVAYGTHVVSYNVILPSKNQQIRVRILTNSLLFGANIVFYRNLLDSPAITPATPFASILVNVGDLGEKTALGTEPFAIGDTLSVGILLIAAGPDGQEISLSAAIALNP